MTTPNDATARPCAIDMIEGNFAWCKPHQQAWSVCLTDKNNEMIAAVITLRNANGALTAERDTLRAQNAKLKEALRGMLNVVHDYLPHMAQRCLKYQEGESNRNYTARDCENTGDIRDGNACEICTARALLQSIENKTSGK